MRATIFEFKYRHIIIRRVYLAAVLCYAFDSEMTSSLMGRWLFSRIGTFDEQFWTRIALLGRGVATATAAFTFRIDDGLKFGTDLQEKDICL